MADFQAVALGIKGTALLKHIVLHVNRDFLHANGNNGLSFIP